MSDNYTWPQRCPDLVQDVSLKRARIDNEDGTSTIRTTSSSSTDVTAITQALGNQTDTISQPSVIGLLKNLVANSGGGGGGGESVTLTVPRIQIYDPIYNNTWGSIQQIYFYDNNTQVYDFPDWADYIGFYSIQSGNLGVCKLKNNASNKTIILEINDFAYPADLGAGTSLQLYKEYIKIELQEITGTPQAPLSMTFNGWKEDWSTNPLTVYQYSNRDYGSVIPFVFSLSSFDISGGGGGGSGQAVNTYSLTINGILANAIDTPINTPASTTDKTLATLGSFQKRYQSWYSSIVFTPDVAKSTADLPSGFQAALYQATEAEFTGSYFDVQVRAKFRLSPNSDETILANPVVCYNTDNGTYSHTRGFILKLEKSSSAVTITMQRGTSIDFENNNNTFNSYVDSTTTFNISYIQLKMTNF